MNSDALIDKIIGIAVPARQGGAPLIDHLTSKFSLRSYAGIAECIYATVPHGHILDWGCGFGQMSFLLSEMGLQVTSYDVEDNTAHPVMKALGVRPVVGTDKTNLPFADASFDAVLSCGVLEHVENEQGSLTEVTRVLKKGGCFFIHRLPNRYSYSEFFATVRGKSDHPVKYTPAGLETKLKAHGFEILRMGRENMIPKNLSFLPLRAKSVFNRHYETWFALENTLVRIPVLSLISGTLYAVARKQ